MNLREFYKKLRSPMGTTLLSLGGLVLLVLLALPLLLRNDAGKLEVNRTVGGKGTYDIHSNIKAIANVQSKPGLIEAKPDSDSKGPPKPPAMPGRPAGASSDSKVSPPGMRGGSYSGNVSPAGRKPLITIIDGETASAGNKEFISERYAPYGRLIACKW